MTANRLQVAVLPGSGIGREVTAEAERVLAWFVRHRGLEVDVAHPAYGPEAYKATGRMLPDASLATLKGAHAILFGAAGGPEYDVIPAAEQRAGGLRFLRKELDLFANLRPVKALEATLDASTLKPEVVRGVDMVIVRELTSGIYFGEPRGIETLADGRRRGVNTQVYTSDEIIRVARVAFELARSRSGRLCSVDKANVLESSVLWREEVVKLHSAEYRDVELSHQYVDNAAMQLVRNPRQFDVILTDNIFGDILSDCAAMITGSLGMLPSASLSAPDALGRRHALFEPVHGSAPDIAGQGIANPLGAILSLAMALRHGLGRDDDAALLEAAVGTALGRCRTGDIAAVGQARASTAAMGQAVLDALEG